MSKENSYVTIARMVSQSATQEPLKMMADFRPLKGWRYNTAKVSGSDVIAPPYDVIYPPEQELLYKRSPYNCVRLILNKIEETDTDSNNRYTRAKQFFLDWQASGHIQQENAPAFYLYRQTYQNPVNGQKLERTAVLGRLRLESFDKGIVVPHEKTLSQARADQRRLLETAEVSFSPVFGLYDDPKKEMVEAVKSVPSGKPSFEAVDDHQVKHEIWAMTDPKTISSIQGIIAKKHIYIADGHHRYQTALEYSQDARKRKNVPEGEELPSDFALIALVEFHDPGLILMPTHRLLLPYAGFEGEKGIEKLKAYFKVEEVSKAELQKRIQVRNNGRDVTLGLAIGKDKFYFLTLQDFEKARAFIGMNKPDVWYRLDVNIVAHLIFKLWNLSESEWEKTLKFTRVESEAFDYAASGKAVAAFMLQPPRVESLREMGEVRELMPQKSTYFYPKLASGLAFYSHR